MHIPSDAGNSGRDLGEEELDLLRHVIDSGVLHNPGGGQVRLLEREFASRIGVARARALQSTVAAMQWALVAAETNVGDEVVVSSLASHGEIAAICYQGSVPVFADIDPLTMNLTPRTVAAQLSSRTRAIIVKHQFGQACDIEAIREVSPGTPIIEDCSYAYLARVNGKTAGTIGDFGVFSLQQDQHITTGEGGLVTTSSEQSDGDRDNQFASLNPRMTELHAAVARAQVCKLEGIVARRQRAAARLANQLIEVEGLTLPMPNPGSTHAYGKYPILVDSGVVPGGSQALSASLKRLGIPATPGSMLKSAAASKLNSRDDGAPAVDLATEFPGTCSALDRLLLLPWNEFYTDKHVDYISFQFHNAMQELMSSHATA